MFTYALVGLLCLAVLSVVLMVYSTKEYDWIHGVAAIAGVVLAIGVALAVIAHLILAWGWVEAGVEAKIINREYGTHYTQEEVFYASDVIDTIREIDRQRVEVNGNLLRGDEKPK